MPLSKVLVTGAAGALGSSVVETLVANGLKVVATYQPGSKPGPEKSGVEWIAINLTDRGDVKKNLISRSDIDGLVHCAGGFRWAKFESTTESDLDFLMKLNFESAFVVTQALLPSFKKKNLGRMVFISAKSTLQPPLGMSAYCASKAALNAWILSSAEEFKGTGIRMNAILPTIIDTPANRKDMGEKEAAKWVKPEAIASLVLDLLKDKNTSIQGALIPISGEL